MKRSLLAVVIIWASLLVGCGGGSGGDNSAPASVTPVANRLIQPSDSVVYSVSGTAVSDTGSYPVTGTVIYDVDNDNTSPLFGDRVFAVTMSFSLMWNSSHHSDIGTFFTEQSDDGTIYEAGSVGARVFSSSRSPITYFSPMSAGQTTSYRIKYDDTTTEQCTVSVGNPEQIAGLNAYPVNTVWSRDSGKSSSSTLWFAPELGYPVKVQSKMDLDDATLNLVWICKSKNF